MKCPRCRQDLSDVRGVAVCLRCGGAFLRAAASDTVRLVFDEDARQTADMAATQGSQRVQTDAMASCPQCSARMRRFRVGPVEVDTCMEHGTWYDRGELEAVRAALSDGVATQEVARPSPVPSAQCDQSSGLELADVVRTRRPKSARLGAIDESSQQAIRDLGRWERRWDGGRWDWLWDWFWASRRRRRRRGLARTIIKGMIDATQDR